MDVKEIKKDRLRFTKNSTSSTLVYLSILLDVIYFVSIYKSDVGNYYYTWLIGASIIFNLLFMLTMFLSSQGVKNYHFGYSVVLIVIGLVQFARILVIPRLAHSAVITLSGEEVVVMGDAQFMRVCIYLAASGVLAIIAGIVGAAKSRILTAYNKELEAKANC